MGYISYIANGQTKRFQNPTRRRVSARRQRVTRAATPFEFESAKCPAVTPKGKLLSQACPPIHPLVNPPAPRPVHPTPDCPHIRKTVCCFLLLFMLDRRKSKKSTALKSSHHNCQAGREPKSTKSKSIKIVENGISNY